LKCSNEPGDPLATTKAERSGHGAADFSQAAFPTSGLAEVSFSEATPSDADSAQPTKITIDSERTGGLKRFVPHVRREVFQRWLRHLE
jgi:hypothetical protein